MSRLKTLAVVASSWMMIAEGAEAGVRAVLKVESQAGSVPDDALVIAKQTVGRTGSPLSDTIVTQAEQGEAMLELTPGTWIVVATAHGYWGAPEEVHVEPESRVTLRLWPTAAISGRLLTSPPQGGLEAAFFPIRQDGPSGLDTKATPRATPPASSVPCTTGRGRFRCELPVSHIDVQLRGSGVGSHFIWDLGLAVGKTVDVGRVAFRKGAFVAGWVRDVAGSPAGGVTVELLAPDGAKLGAQRNLRLSAVADARGFFQIGPVRAGSYLAAFRRDGSGVLEAPLQLTAEGQTYLSEPFVVGTTCRLEVALTPALDPWGEAWSVDLVGYTGERPRMLERASTAGRTGQWAHKLVTPGRYLLGIFGQSRSQWHTQPIELAEGGCERLHVEIRTVPARGTLRPRGKAVGGRLTLVNSQLKVRIPFIVDPSGGFAGFLPESALEHRDGWSASLESVEPRLRQTIQGVELTPDPIEGGLRVVVAVSELSLSGVVLDHSGAAWQDSATVSLQSSERNEPPTQVRLAPAAAGRFELNGFPAGRYTIWADAADASTRRQTVEMEKGSDHPAIELRLEPGRTIRGRVMSTEGAAIPGALVVAFPPESFMEFVAPVHSGGDGSFELRVPPGVRQLAIRAQARGFAYELTTVALREAEPLIVVLEASGGTLVLESTEPLDAELMTHVLREGSFEETRGLREWAAQNGVTNAEPDRLVVPQMAAGGYSVCRAAVAEGRELFAGALPESRCVSGTLAPGADLTLTVPASRPPSKP